MKLLGSIYAAVSSQTRSENKSGGGGAGGAMPLSEFLSELSCPLFCDAGDTVLATKVGTALLLCWGGDDCMDNEEVHPRDAER